MTPMLAMNDEYTLKTYIWRKRKILKEQTSSLFLFCRALPSLIKYFPVSYWD